MHGVKSWITVVRTLYVMFRALCQISTIIIVRSRLAAKQSSGKQNASSSAGYELFVQFVRRVKDPVSPSPFSLPPLLSHVPLPREMIVLYLACMYFSRSLSFFLFVIHSSLSCFPSILLSLSVPTAGPSPCHLSASSHPLPLPLAPHWSVLHHQPSLQFYCRSPYTSNDTTWFLKLRRPLDPNEITHNPTSSH